MSTLGAVVIAVAAGGGAWAASSGSGQITACVHKQGGGLYIAKRCARHDSKRTWSEVGPRGPAGADGTNGRDGTNGKDGTNGAVAGFSASSASHVDISTTATTVLTKALPAGSFIVNGKTMLVIQGGSQAEYANDICELSDGSVTDTAQWMASPSAWKLATTYYAAATVPFDIAVTSASPSTVSLACFSSGSNVSVGNYATDADITAIQTSSNS